MYAKVFASMWDGTLGQSWEGWSVFVYLLANCQSDGVIDQTPEAIAARSGIPLEKVELGLRVLEQPDRRSRSAEEAGRRLVKLDDHRDWGWRIVNYQHYRRIRDEESRRQYQREWVANKRLSTPVDTRRPPSTQEEGEVEEEESNLLVDQKRSTDTQSELLAAPLNGQNLATKRKPVRARLPHGEPEGFAPWYELYPRHVARLDAAKAYRQMVHSEADAEKLNANTKLWAKRWFDEDRDERHVKHPATFLRSGQWQEPPEVD